MQQRMQILRLFNIARGQGGGRMIVVKIIDIRLRFIMTN